MLSLDNATSSLQAALDNLVAKGGTLHLPAGRYRLTAPLKLTGASRCRIVGDGPGATILQRVAPFGSVLTLSLCSDLEVAGIGIDAAYAAHPGEANHGLVLVHCDRVLVDRVQVEGAKNTGILAYAQEPGRYGNIHLHHCKVDGKGVGQNGILIANLARSGMRDCSVIDCPGFYGLQLKNLSEYCYIRDCIAEGCLVGVAFGQDTGRSAVRYSVVSGVQVVGCHQGISIGNASYNQISDVMIIGKHNLYHAIDIANSSYNSLDGISVLGVRGAEGNVAVRLQRGSRGNNLYLPTIAAASVGQLGLVAIGEGCAGNLVELGKLSGIDPSMAIVRTSPGNQVTLPIP